MKKVLQSVARGALAVALAVTMAPIPAFALAEDEVPSYDVFSLDDLPVGSSPEVTSSEPKYYFATDIAKKLGMDTSQPMDLNKIVAAVPGVHTQDGAYILDDQLRLNTGTYCLSEDLNIKAGNANAGMVLFLILIVQDEYLSAWSGLCVDDKAEVTIDLNGHTLSARGTDAGAGTGGDDGENASSDSHGRAGALEGTLGLRSQPGIYLPESSTLTFVGAGTVNAIGGNAGDGGKGGNGGAGYAEPHLLTSDDYWGGGAGAPGSPGAGASAGIGTSGGGATCMRASGKAPAQAPAAGKLVVQEDTKGSITLNLQGGKAGTNGAAGQAGEDKYKKDWTGKCWGGGGGAGGGSGAGGVAPGYGQGAQGGIEGWYGTRGECDCDEKGSHKGGAELAGGNGWMGNAGKAQQVTWKDPLNANYTVEFYYSVNNVFSDTPTSKATRLGKVGETVSLTEEDKIPTRESYVFVPQSTCEGVVNADGSTTLKAYFRQEFSITYAPGEHGTFDEVTTNHLVWGSAMPEAPQVEGEAGWHFTGWDARVAKKVTESVVYTAQWEENGDAPYLVEYFKMGANGEYPSAPSFISEERHAAAGSTVSITGDDAMLGGEGYGIDMMAPDKVLTAELSDDPTNPTYLRVYFSRVFTVTYEPGDHGAFEPMVYENAYYGVLTPPFDESEAVGEAGWHFAGWDKDLAESVTDDATYTAQWAANEDTPYTVTSYYMVDGSYEASIPSRQSYEGTTGTEVQLSDEQMAPRQPDYVYDPNQANVTKAVINGDGSTEFVLYFKQSFTVTFDAGEHGSFEGGQQTAAITDLTFGAEMPDYPPVASDECWQFAGWVPGYSSDAKVFGSVTFVAQYVSATVEYTVETYYEGDGPEPRGVYAREGAVGETVQVTDRDLLPEVVNYVFDSEAVDNKLQGEVLEDGSLVLRVYFKKDGNIQKGDVTMNGVINIVDAQITYDVACGAYKDPEAVLKPLNASEPVLFWLMDVNEDSVIDAGDSRAIQSFAVLGEWPERTL